MSTTMQDDRIDWCRALNEASAYLTRLSDEARADRELSAACPDRAAPLAPASYPLAVLDPNPR